MLFVDALLSQAVTDAHCMRESLWKTMLSLRKEGRRRQRVIVLLAAGSG